MTLEVEGLVKHFGATRALAGMSWSAPAGRITALLGPNGSGKTTAMRCVTGILRPDAGTVTILGDATPRGREAISFLPEFTDLYPALSVAEHLRFVALGHRLDAGWEARAADLLDRFQLTDKADDVPSDLSQGQRRKTAICAALLHGASVLLFDEPFNGLDPHAAGELRVTLQGLAADGATVVVSTHGLAAAERFVDRAVIVAEGHSRAEGSLDDLRTTAGLDPDSDLELIYLAHTGTTLDDTPAP